ncbi:MAG: DNA-3-methyladenine glycosylase [Thermobacillus sp.]|uniref:DNA-3-methyladenine glycosylase n=1 Tax=Thermobacillus sp. TaxID=2108467 RepID=UPI000E361116|nr:DNA-3-methyladenine glycosylase [Thermobacillus sp.]REK58012.1 MAG: DNA-3-methyladenine glycosylase [Thermobacillus sp.]
MSVRMEPVRDGFFDRPTLELAQALLGMLLVCVTEEGAAAGRIVETEAYIGPEDRAAHSCGNRRTPRTEVMFGPPGRAYVYVMHTHSLFNVTSGKEGKPEAVLVRAVEPVLGLELMRARRGPVKRPFDLTNGPGKLTKALGITKADYGRPLTAPPLFIAQGRPAEAVACGPRIGIEGSGEARFYPWRFWEAGNPYVSRGRGAAARE